MLQFKPRVFWKSLKKRLNVKPNVEFPIKELENYYFKCFNQSTTQNINNQTTLDTNNQYSFHNFSIKLQEIKEFIDNLPNWKACGYSNETYEVFKYGKNEQLIIALKVFFDKIFQKGMIPENFNISIIQPII